MPNRNGTGPTGNGPQTGRGLGSCDVKEKKNLSFGRGQGCRKRNQIN